MTEKEISRRYINDGELERFLFASRSEPAYKRTLCFLLALTGCQISEALSLKICNVDLTGRAILFLEGGKRLKSVPISDELAQMLDIVHSLSFVRQEMPHKESEFIWKIDRATASKWVSATMFSADIHGPQASARGLRHGFAVRSLALGHSAHTVAYWMGLPVQEVIKNYEPLAAKERSP